MAKKYKVLDDYDFVVRPNVIRHFTKGDEHEGLTRAMISDGEARGKLEAIKQEKSNG